MPLLLAFANVVPSVFNVINSVCTLARLNVKKNLGNKGREGEGGSTAPREEVWPTANSTRQELPAMTPELPALKYQGLVA